jgi:hypothetical protein
MRNLPLLLGIVLIACSNACSAAAQTPATVPTPGDAPTDASPSRPLNAGLTGIVPRNARIAPNPAKTRAGQLDRTSPPTRASSIGRMRSAEIRLLAHNVSARSRSASNSAAAAALQPVPSNAHPASAKRVRLVSLKSPHRIGALAKFGAAHRSAAATAMRDSDLYNLPTSRALRPSQGLISPRRTALPGPTVFKKRQMTAFAQRKVMRALPTTPILPLKKKPARKAG